VTNRKSGAAKQMACVRARMSLYLDTHKGTELPGELRRTVQTRVRSGEKDGFGVVDRGIIIDNEAGEMHCVLDAPNVEAVRQHHAALNVPLDGSTVHRADAILK